MSPRGCAHLIRAALIDFPDLDSSPPLVEEMALIEHQTILTKSDFKLTQSRARARIIQQSAIGICVRKERNTIPVLPGASQLKLSVAPNRYRCR